MNIVFNLWELIGLGIVGFPAFNNFNAEDLPGSDKILFMERVRMSVRTVVVN